MNSRPWPIRRTRTWPKPTRLLRVRSKKGAIMEAIILALITSLPTIITGVTSAVQNIQRIVKALRENAASLDATQLALLDELETRLVEGLADVAGVVVRPKPAVDEPPVVA